MLKCHFHANQQKCDKNIYFHADKYAEEKIFRFVKRRVTDEDNSAGVDRKLVSTAERRVGAGAVSGVLAETVEVTPAHGQDTSWHRQIVISDISGHTHISHITR